MLEEVRATSRNNPPLVAIVGPTAVGKTAIALEMAERLGAEIVSADSRQVYRFMDIGTAKPTTEERARAAHHLIDFVDPDQDYSLALYQAQAYETIGNIHRAGRLPLLVGGSGLYVWAVLRGLVIPRVPPNPALRQELEDLAQKEGLDSLLPQLEELDPVTALAIDRRNPRRIIRAIEVCRAAGQPLSNLRRETPPPYNITVIGLSVSRSDLHQRIDRRVDRMIEAGLVEETQRLLDRGYDLGLPAMTSPGYREIGLHLVGQLRLVEAIARTKVATHRLARRQYTWFSLQDRRIHWFEGAMESLPDILAHLESCDSLSV